MNDFKESKETFVSQEKRVFNNNVCTAYRRCFQEVNTLIYTASIKL